MGMMQEAWYAVWMTSTKDRDYTTSTKDRDYLTSTITRRVRFHDEYNYTASSEGHDYVYGIDDGKGLADGVGR